MKTVGEDKLWMNPGRKKYKKQSSLYLRDYESDIHETGMVGSWYVLVMCEKEPLLWTLFLASNGWKTTKFDFIDYPCPPTGLFDFVSLYEIKDSKTLRCCCGHCNATQKSQTLRPKSHLLYGKDTVAVRPLNWQKRAAAAEFLRWPYAIWLSFTGHRGRRGIIARIYNFFHFYVRRSNSTSWNKRTGKKNKKNPLVTVRLAARSP